MNQFLSFGLLRCLRFVQNVKILVVWIGCFVGTDLFFPLVCIYNSFLSFFDKSCEVLKELDHDYIFDLRSAFWRGFFFPEKLFYSKFWFCFSFTGPTLDSRDHFLNETFTTMKVWEKNANLRQLWTQLPNSVKFFYLTHRYVKKANFAMHSRSSNRHVYFCTCMYEY